MAQLVKNPPARRETWVRSLGWEDPLEKGKATHSTILAWRIPWTVLSMGLQRVGHDWATVTFTMHGKRAYQVVLVVKNPSANAGDMRHGFDPWVEKIPWRRAWPPTPVFLLGESHGQGSLLQSSQRIGHDWSDLAMHACIHSKCVV